MVLNEISTLKTHFKTRIPKSKNEKNNDFQTNENIDKILDLFNQNES